VDKFNLVMKRPHGRASVATRGFAVHSVPFFYLAMWFEEFLGGPVSDETALSGLYVSDHPHLANRGRA